MILPRGVHERFLCILVFLFSRRAIATAVPMLEASTRILQAGEMDQINEILSGVTLSLNTTTRQVGDTDGGFLSFIDLNLEIDATEQVEELLVDRVIDIPQESFSFAGRRTRRSLRESFKRTSSRLSEGTYQCDVEALDADVGGGFFSSGGDGFLELLTKDLEFKFGDEINQLLDDFTLDDECFSIAGLAGGRRRSLLNGRVASNARALQTSELSLVFGRELSSFISDFDFTIPDYEETFSVDVFGNSYDMQLSLQDIQCGNFALRRLETNIQINSGFTTVDDLDIGIQASATDVYASCAGTVTYGLGGLNVQATFRTQAVLDTFELDLQYAGGSLSVNSCSTELTLTAVDLFQVKFLFITLPQNIVNRIFDIVERRVLTILSDIVNPSICDALEAQLTGPVGEATESAIALAAAADAIADTSSAPQGQICLTDITCEDVLIDDGLEVEFDGLEDVSIKIRDFAMTCTANANVNILDVEATATVEIDLDIPTIDLGAEFGESLTINSCTANVDINSIDVQNLRIQFGNIDLQIPDSLTDVIVDQIDEAVIELIDGQADQALCDALSSGTIPGFATRKRGRYLTGNRQGRELQNIDATVSLEEGFCQDITVRQVFATSEQKTTEALDVLVEIDQIETECFGTVTFEVIGYSGSLNFEASVRAPTLDLDVLLLSTNLNRELPSSGCVTDCRSSVRVDSLQFDDLKVKGIPKDIVQVVVDALRDPVSEVVESLGGDAICSNLDQMAPRLIDDFLPPPGGEDSDQDITISDTVCSSISIREITIQSNKVSDQLVSIPTTFDGLQMTCVGKARFTLGSVIGTADFTITATTEPLTLDFGLVSGNFSELPPDNSTVRSCSSTLTAQNAVLSNLVTTNLQEGLSGTLEGLLNNLLGGFIEEEGGGVLCSNLETAAPESFDPFVQQLSTPILGMIATRPPIDQLIPESNYTAPDGILDFTTLERTTVEWFLSILVSPFLDFTFVNDIVSGLLDEDGKAVITPAALGGDIEPVVLDLDVANITIHFENAKIFGLDSFSFFGDRILFGKYTFGAPFELEYLYAEVDLMVEILPKDTNTIDFEPNEVIVEHITVHTNLTEVDGFFALFLPIFEPKLAELPPFTLDFNCLLPTFDRLELTQFTITSNLSETPIISNFSSIGTERLAQQSLDAFWVAYEKSLALALPNFLQEVLRPILNRDVFTPLIEGAGNRTCNLTDSDSANRGSDVDDVVEPNDVSHQDESLSDAPSENIQTPPNGVPPNSEKYGEVVESINSLFGGLFSGLRNFHPAGSGSISGPAQ